MTSSGSSLAERLHVSMLGVLTPEEHGGIGGDLLSTAVVWEEEQ